VPLLPPPADPTVREGSPAARGFPNRPGSTAASNSFDCPVRPAPEVGVLIPQTSAPAEAKADQICNIRREKSFLRDHKLPSLALPMPPPSHFSCPMYLQTHRWAVTTIRNCPAGLVRGLRVGLGWRVLRRGCEDVVSLPFTGSGMTALRWRTLEAPLDGAEAPEIFHIHVISAALFGEIVGN